MINTALNLEYKNFQAAKENC